MSPEQDDNSQIRNLVRQVQYQSGQIASLALFAITALRGVMSLHGLESEKVLKKIADDVGATLPSDKVEHDPEFIRGFKVMADSISQFVSPQKPEETQK